MLQNWKTAKTIQSATKSVMSLLIGIAEGEGILSLNDYADAEYYLLRHRALNGNLTLHEQAYYQAGEEMLAIIDNS